MGMLLTNDILGKSQSQRQSSRPFSPQEKKGMPQAVPFEQIRQLLFYIFLPDNLIEDHAAKVRNGRACS
jgi:hypothetical protein